MLAAGCPSAVLLLHRGTRVRGTFKADSVGPALVSGVPTNNRALRK